MQKFYHGQHIACVIQYAQSLLNTKIINKLPRPRVQAYKFFKIALLHPRLSELQIEIQKKHTEKMKSLFESGDADLVPGSDSFKAFIDEVKTPAVREILKSIRHTHDSESPDKPCSG